MADDVKKDKSSESSTEEKKGNPADEGKSRVMPDGRTVEDVWAENKRKSEEISKLKEEIDSIKYEMDDLREKSSANKGGANGENTDDDIDAIRKDPKNQKLVKLIQKESEDRIMSSLWQEDIVRANRMVEREAKSLGMDLEKFKEELRPYASKYSNQMPSFRNEAAIEEFRRNSTKLADIEKREAELKKREESEKLYRETGSRVPREQSAIGKLSQTKGFNKQISLINDILMSAQNEHEINPKE